MSFISIEFFALIALTALLYTVLPKMRRWVLLTASLVFYLSYGWSYLPFIIVTTVTTFFAAKKIAFLREGEPGDAERKKAKTVLILTLVLNLGILIVGKLLNYIGIAADCDALVKYVIIPLGVSYYTFSTVGYLLDVYWSRYGAETDFVQFLLFTCYFPHVVQGPISRYDQLGSELKNLTPITYDRLCAGLQLMLWGYFKKLLIVNRIRPFVTDIFGSTANFGALYLVALAADVVMIYTDFSGYMDIMRGVSDIFGVTLERNFDHPFFSKSVSEFWRRWHMSLGSWFKDYVYMPLSMSAPMVALYGKLAKKKNRRFAKNVTTVLSLLTVWILTGLWHGTGLGYVMWGVYYGTIIAVSVICEKNYKNLNKRLRIDTGSWWFNGFRIVRTWICFAGGRLITKGESFSEALSFFRSIVTNLQLRQVFIKANFTSHHANVSSLVQFVVYFALFFVVEILQTKYNIREEIKKRNVAIRWAVWIIGIVVVLAFGVIDSSNGIAGFEYQNF